MNEELHNIIEQVGYLYEKYGIKSITMDDVSREVGISKKTLYNHVANKEDLIDKYIEYKIQQKRCDINDIFHKNLNAIEELLEVNKHIIETIKNYNPSLEYDLKKYYPSHYKKVREKRMNHIYTALIENMKKGKQQGYYRKEVKEEIIARIHVGRIENSFTNELFSIEELSSRDFINEMIIYHIRGIANDKGIAFLEKKMESQY